MGSLQLGAVFEAVRRQEEGLHRFLAGMAGIRAREGL